MSTPSANGPRISVVTPSFNQGRFLDQCIRSVLEQNYPNLEYIIIDGGSSDESVSVIRKYEQRLASWVSEKDKGQADAINKGFRRATGEIVAWLNADDFYIPGAFACIAAQYQQNREASFYFGNGIRANEAGQDIGGFFPNNKVLFDEQALIMGLNYILQPAAFINRARLVQIDYLDPNLHYGLDSDLWMRLARTAPPVPVQACLAASREYGATKTSTGSFVRVEELRKISEKHSGMPVSPGALCYYFDTLHRLAVERPDVYPLTFLVELQLVWRNVQHLLSRFGARVDGFPLDRAAAPGTPAEAPPLPPDLAVIPRLHAKVLELETERAETQLLVQQLTHKLAVAEEQLRRTWVEKATGRLRRLPGGILRRLTNVWSGPPSEDDTRKTAA